MSARTSSPQRWWLASLVLVAAGTTISAYLLGRTFSLLATARPNALDLCLRLFSVSCDTALLERRSWVASLPMAGWALVSFTTLGSLLFLGRFLKESFAAEALVAGSLLTLVSVVAGFLKSLAATLVRASPCPLCLVVLTIELLLLFTLYKASAAPGRAKLGLLKTAAEWLFRAKPDAAATRWKLVGFGSVALVTLVTYQWIYVETTLRLSRAGSRPAPAEVISAYRVSPTLALPVSEDDPHLGSLDAPVQLVVFMSLQCPACRNFSASLSRLHQEFGDRLLVDFKHYPLSTQCNPRLDVDKQPRACDLAFAAEAAHRQGRFWTFHDAIFAAQEAANENTIAHLLPDLGLDPVRFTADRHSESTLARVAKDVELGNRLQIPGTPAVFLAGHLVRPADEETLEILIREELRLAGERAVRQDPVMEIEPALVRDNREAH